MLSTTRREQPAALPPVQDEQLDALVAVLDDVRHERRRSRPEIMHSTGLTRSVVQQRVSELVARGLLLEGRLGPSTGGRAPRQLEFAASAGHVITAALGATSIDVAVADLGGALISHQTERADISDGPERILSRVEALFEQITTVTDLPGELWGVGIGVPGPVDFDHGNVVAPPIMPGWDDFPIRERFSACYNVPVWVDNDANVMTLGELRAGAARGHDTVVFVKIGTGIGAGIVIAGRLHRGAQGSAGDVGHMQIASDSEVVCRCGKIGCLEALAGGAALARDARALAAEGLSPQLVRRMSEQDGHLEAADVSWAASHGDAASARLIARSGNLVGEALSSMVHILNPSLIVIGGGVSRAGDPLLAAIRESVYRQSLPLATRELEIRTSALGPRSGVIGVATMVTDELFSRGCLANWVDAGSPTGRPGLASAGSR
ncbi:MAG TPA: ROK family protein [Solirubrobacteraceae bacterium]|nr:ROK family protein [Solirubrobacteraceae bacterium]